MQEGRNDKTKKRHYSMTPQQKITAFSKKIADKEGGKVNLTIAQIAEVLRCANELTDGILYVIIRGMDNKRNKIK
jgi:hypothetical protein